MVLGSSGGQAAFRFPEVVEMLHGAVLFITPVKSGSGGSVIGGFLGVALNPVPLLPSSCTICGGGTMA